MNSQTQTSQTTDTQSPFSKASSLDSEQYNTLISQPSSLSEQPPLSQQSSSSEQLSSSEQPLSQPLSQPQPLSEQPLSQQLSSSEQPLSQQPSFQQQSSQPQPEQPLSQQPLSDQLSSQPQSEQLSSEQLSSQQELSSEEGMNSSTLDTTSFSESPSSSLSMPEISSTDPSSYTSSDPSSYPSSDPSSYPSSEQSFEPSSEQSIDPSSDNSTSEISSLYDNTQQTPQEITPEEYEQLNEKEKSVRSKIINQPPPCQKKSQNPNPIFVEKVQLNTPLTQNELFISNLIKTHPFAYLYFQPLIETYPLTIGSITECDNPEIQQANQTELIEGKYKEVGNQTLEEFLSISRQQNPQNFIQLVVHSHLQLLDSIAILQSLEPPVIHFNITPQTILYDKTNGTPVITDFRIAFTKKTLDTPEESDELFPPYENNPSWPVEVFYLSHLLNSTEIPPPFQSPTNQPIDTTNIQNKDKQQLKETYQSWDTYAVNQFIYSFMTTQNIPFTIPFMRTYKELLTQELIAEPSSRSTIPTLQSKIKECFKSVPKKEYLHFLEQLHS